MTKNRSTLSFQNTYIYLSLDRYIYFVFCTKIFSDISIKRRINLLSFLNTVNDNRDAIIHTFRIHIYEETGYIFVSRT